MSESSIAKELQRLREESPAFAEEVEDIRWLMEQVRGRRHIWGLLSKCGIYRTSFTGNSTTFFNEGERNIGLKYMGIINRYCPEQYPIMVREANNRESDMEDSNG